MTRCRRDDDTVMKRTLGLVIAVLAVSLGVPVLGSGAGASVGSSAVGVASATESAARRESHRVAMPEPPPTTAPPTTTAPAGLDPMLVEVLTLVNAERAQRGIAPLQIQAQLNQAAQVHSEDQARRNTLTHYGPNGETPGDRIDDTGYQYRTWGENAAMGFRSAASVMTGWMNSPGHRQNILNSAFTEIGLGIAVSSSGAPYWTQVFAAPRS